MKTMLVLCAAFLLVGGLIAPVRAQGDKVTVTFEITEASTPCPNATYWAAYGLPASEFVAQQLTDGNNDGVYTGSIQVEVGGIDGTLAVQLLQGIGTQESIYGPIPGQPSSTIKNFGFVTFTQDTLITGQATGCAAGLPNAGSRNNLPLVPLAGGMLLLATGVCLRRRMWLGA